MKIRIKYQKKYFVFLAGLSVVVALAFLAVFKFNLLENLKIQPAKARDVGLGECNPVNVGYKFSIKRPNDSEMVFINNSGHLAFNGTLIQIANIENERQWGYGCTDNNYYEYRIDNGAGISTASFVYCNQDQQTKVYFRGIIREGPDSFNFLTWPRFIIENHSGDTVAAIDQNGNVGLYGCYQDLYPGL